MMILTPPRCDYCAGSFTSGNGAVIVDSFWDFLWLIIVSFAFIAYLMVLFSIIGDQIGRAHV